MVQGGFLWFKVGFMVPGEFLLFFIVPGWFLLVTVCFFMVLQGFRLVFNGSRLVVIFFMVSGRFFGSMRVFMVFDSFRFGFLTVPDRLFRFPGQFL